MSNVEDICTFGLDRVLAGRFAPKNDEAGKEMRR